MNEYQQNELEELEYFTEERKKAFEINDLESLTWAFKKLASINTELKEKEDVANAERIKIDEWLKRSSEPLKHSKEFFEYHIKAYHEKELANNPDKKSISTPYGKIKSTTTKAQAAIKDELAVIEYLKSIGNTSLVVEKESVKWSDLKKQIHVLANATAFYDSNMLAEVEYVAVDDFGNIIPGVEVKPKNTTFKIEEV